MDPIIMRMIERLLGVILGGLSIILGFFLFKLIPHQTDSEGKFIFPGGSVHLTRTGPGIFFALFGCLIIFWSFTNPIKTGNFYRKTCDYFTVTIYRYRYK